MKIKHLLLSSIIFIVSFYYTKSISAQSIALTSPAAGSTFISGTTFAISAEITNPTYLHVTNLLTGYRKLKIGYSAVNMYSPMYDVVNGGNTTMEITLCNFGSSVDWSKLSVRPQGNTSAPVVLSPYVTAVGGIGSSWKTISIPLSAFSATINFAQISLIELPYSSNAGSFDIGISKIAFTGGSTPFVWFGPEHTSNIHNGNGGSGELVAQLVTPTAGSIAVDHVEFYSNNELIGTSASIPYSFSYTAVAIGNFNLSAIAKYVDGTYITSAPVSVHVIAQPVSQLNVAITSPLSGSVYNSPTDVLVTAGVTGFSNADPAWIHITNTQTGYRKLKLGFSSSSLYSPLQNVIAGGNTTLEITLKDILGNTNWNKIQIRPQAGTTLPVCLAPYIAAVGGLGNEWKTISIPLSAFDPSVNFSQLSFIEIPYSQSAGNLDLGIQQIRFTGGTNPFLWFGSSKTDNLHNGNGGSGELVATVVPSAPGGPSVDHIDFYQDNILMGSDNTAPYQFLLSNPAAGDHLLMVKLTDNSGLTKQSEQVNILINAATPNNVTLTVLFDQAPGNVVIQKSALRYNKDFAYSFTLDDGLIDAYTVAFPLLNGGLVSGNNTVYPGYFYSDGCGNAIPFKAGISWYSVNSACNDLHINTPAYITWGQLTNLYNAGWNVFNHSYSHAAYGTTDYVSQIVQNANYVNTKCGIDMPHFVIPSGDQGYILPAFANGMLTVNGNNGAFRGSPTGYRIDQPIDFNNFRLYKMLVSDANQNTANIMLKINTAAASSINGQHYWWSDFTHHVGFQSSGSSLLFPLFQYYMDNVAQQYGITGADNLWMAPTQDVYEYLSVRDNCVLGYTLNGNVLTISIDYSGVPANLRTNALTLAIQADQNYTSVIANGAQGLSFNGSGTNKIINVNWGNAVAKAAVTNSPAANQSITNITSAEDVSVYPNPFTNRIQLDYTQSIEGDVYFELLDMTGKTIYNKTIHQTDSSTHFELDLSSYNILPGNYLLKAANGQTKLYTLKVVKVVE
ncbi:MAG: T9SS type A sorting domain-containing protein [Bacteroidales bacterium]